MRSNFDIILDIAEILLIMSLSYAYVDSHGALEKLQHEAVEHGYATCVNRHFRWVEAKK